MRPSYFDSNEYKEKQGKITHSNWQKGIYNFLIKRKRRNCLNKSCGNHFIVPPSDKQKYCSQNCWYFTRRGHRLREFLQCMACGKLITQRNALKFCSLKCQARNEHIQFIDRWKQGIEGGNIGITTKLISGHIKRYLREKYNDRCSICDWNKKNPITNKVPLEVDHIDGNHENNSEENLRLICPNCHSLTANFRNLNKGKGRAWRMKKIRQQTNPSKTS